MSRACHDVVWKWEIAFVSPYSPVLDAHRLIDDGPRCRRDSRSHTGSPPSTPIETRASWIHRLLDCELHTHLGCRMTWNFGDHTLKVPVKRYRIGELVRYSPFSRQTIHNYTIMGLIREAEWTQGGHRLYDESVFDRLSRIMELKKTKSLTEIRRILTNEERAAHASVSNVENPLGSPPSSGISDHTDVDRAPDEEH